MPGHQGGRIIAVVNPTGGPVSQEQIAAAVEAAKQNPHEKNISLSALPKTLGKPKGKTRHVSLMIPSARPTGTSRCLFNFATF